MGDTKIEWTEKTWNPIRARRIDNDERGWYCEHVSEGCRNCYAERMNSNTYFGNGLEYKPATLPQVELFLDEKILQQPLHWRNAQQVFPCSMTDLFGRWVKDEWIDEIFAVMARARQHTFQVLTKRPERMREYLTARNVKFRLEALPVLDDHSIEIGLSEWPLPNVWLGVSVEDQQTADERIPLLLETPAAVRWISAEPLLGPLNIFAPTTAGRLEGKPTPLLDWVVVGGESGPNARELDLAWARGILAQCRAASVPAFVKQLGAKPIYHEFQIDEQRRPTRVDPYRFNFKDAKGGDINEFPEDLRIREFPHARRMEARDGL